MATSDTGADTHDENIGQMNVSELRAELSRHAPRWYNKDDRVVDDEIQHGRPLRRGELCGIPYWLGLSIGVPGDVSWIRNKIRGCLDTDREDGPFRQNELADILREVRKKMAEENEPDDE